MLDLAGNSCSAVIISRHTFDSPVIAFSAAGGKIDFLRLSADTACNRCSRFGKSLPGFTGKSIWL